jgi:N-glycosylase/DNA lyase
VAAHLPEGGALDLARTLQSGQAFRWRCERVPDGDIAAVGVLGRDVFRLSQDRRGLWLLAPDTPDARARLIDYLGVSPGARTLPSIEAALAADAVIARILPRTRGIGILAQDPWEVLVSFIVSANNNIPKICQSIERLCRSLGAPLGDGAYAFPTPERLAAARSRTLAACLLGYRAPYVRAAARLIADGRPELPRLARMPLEHAREGLLEIPGVGEKVADCVLLFGLRHTSAFPVDVWVRRAVERLYFHGRPRTARQIQEFARARFGPLAGYAQQHLFCYARAHLRPRVERRPGPSPGMGGYRAIAANA